MKKAMAILLAAVLALACTACGGSKNGETKDRLAQIKEKGYIELCTEPYFAPYEYVDPNKSGEDQYQGMDIEVARYIADKLGVERDDVENHGKLVEHLWEHFYEDKLYEPTFVRDFPVETSPLVKGHRSKPGVVEKWDLYVRGFELATGYSELNDPIVQRERFVAQAKDALAGDEEACDIDEDFLEALGVGMPPAGGMGMGIDRLLIALTGATIRETITFPLVKPLVG